MSLLGSPSGCTNPAPQSHAIHTRSGSTPASSSPHGVRQEGYERGEEAGDWRERGTRARRDAGPCSHLRYHPDETSQYDELGALSTGAAMAGR